MKIIAFTGYKRSGKDTAADIVTRLLLPKQIVRLGFADPLKDEVCQAFHITREFLEAHKSNFRLILQGVGTDYRRQLCGENYWVLKWLQKVNSLTPTPDYIICTDVRFINEAATIRQLYGRIIRIQRPDVTSDGHQSETEQQEIHADTTINNDGTIQDLQTKLKTILNSWQS